jgi:hypothetical protein
MRGASCAPLFFGKAESSGVTFRLGGLTAVQRRYTLCFYMSDYNM